MSHYDYLRVPPLHGYAGLSGPLEDTLVAAVGDSIKESIRKGLTRYQAYNVIRFADPNIKDAELTRRMEAKDYLPPFKAYREGIALALKVANLGKAPKASEINDAAFDNFKKIYAAAMEALKVAPPAPSSGVKLPVNLRLPPRFPSAPGGSGGGFPVIPVALAAAAVGAFLLLRKKG